MLGIALRYIRKMSSSVTSAKREFNRPYCSIIHLPGGGHCPLARDSEPIRLLKIPTSLSLYMIITITIYKLGHVAISRYFRLMDNVHLPRGGKFAK